MQTGIICTRPHQQLSFQQVREIYAHKILIIALFSRNSSSIGSLANTLQVHNNNNHHRRILHHHLRGQRESIAEKYGTSARTVRNIWNHMSWIHVTRDLWELVDDAATGSWQTAEAPTAAVPEFTDPFHDDWSYWQPGSLEEKECVTPNANDNIDDPPWEV